MQNIQIADSEVVDNNEEIVQQILEIIECEEALVTDLSNLRDFTINQEQLQIYKEEIENAFDVELSSLNFKDMIEEIQSNI